MHGNAPALLEGYRLTKSYDGVTVVDDVNVTVRHGEIRAVIGENGAGKSTLMNMLTGIARPDSGEIRLRGGAIDLLSPRAAAHAGIAIVHQELHLVPLQSVADNLMLMHPPGARGIRRGTRAERAYVRSIIDQVGLLADPQTPVYQLSAAQCQMLEIAKALALDAQVIIFDEPTAALLPAEAQRLLELIESLRAQGKGILYVSHALDEILRLANRISVLRDGRLVADLQREQADKEALIRAMVDRPVGLYAQELPPVSGADVVLQAAGVATRHVRDVTFELRAGEIIGFAGLMGSGMQEAALAIAGEHRLTAGTLRLDGQPRHFHSPHHAARAGIAMVPEERKREGIFPDLSVCENFHVGRYQRHARGVLVSPRRLRDSAAELVRQFQIRLASVDQPIATLSGGNQQKVLIARCVQSNPRVLIVAAPTRGVDIGAKDAIHQLILQLAARGTAIILISPELEEVLGLSHRIAVFSQGRMVTVLPRDLATATRVMQLAIDGTQGNS